MKSRQTTKKLSTTALLRRSFRLERQGRYAQALDRIDENWYETGFLPPVEELDPQENTELLLRFGSLVGFAGHLESTAGAQERSRDILMDARMRALALENAHLAADCENYLALSYWRTGEHREAEVWLDEAFARPLPKACDARLYSYVVRLLVNLAQGRHSENIELGRTIESDFRINGDPFLVGNLYSNLGISLRNMGRIEEALNYLTLARNYFEQARHWIYATAVENNLAILHKNEGRYHEAHAAVDSALSRYKKLRDRTREGSSLETKAQILVAEHRFDDALAVIDRSISILRKGENHAYLAESIATKAKIYLEMGSFADAMLTLSEAIDIARTHTGEPAARRMIADFQAVLGQRDDPTEEKMPASVGELELIIPESLSQFDDYQGVWVHNSYLENMGVERGSLVLIVRGTPSRGEPAALMINDTQQVACGLYDAEFGMIGLDGDGHEPMLFPEGSVTVLGKIVGLCKKEKRSDGRTIVEPIARHA